MEPSSSHRQSRFATTRWSVVMSAGHVSSPGSSAALEQLCESYWKPLYAYARRRVSSISEAQDLTQAFFVSFLEKNIAGAADPDRGRFRAFVLTAFRNFLSKEWDKAKAEKRGGGRLPLSLDFAAAESGVDLAPASGLTAQQLFDRQWAMTLLSKTMGVLELEADPERFEALKHFLISDEPGLTYADAAEQLGINEVATRQAVSRLRKRYRELLRSEILETVSKPQEIDEEIRNLFETMQL